MSVVARTMGGVKGRQQALFTASDLELGGAIRWVWGEGVTGERVYQPQLDVYLDACLRRDELGHVLGAMACGLPVVVTDAGGTREAVRDGIDGFVVPCRDVEAMAEALVRLARDPELRRRMGEAGRRRVLEEFTLDRQTREWMEFYEAVVRGVEAGGG